MHIIFPSLFKTTQIFYKSRSNRKARTKQTNPAGAYTSEKYSNTHRYCGSELT